MDKLSCQFIIYRSILKDPIINNINDIIKQLKQDNYDENELISKLNEQVYQLLQIATEYGFNDNLWQNYLTYLLITSENAYSYVCEKSQHQEGSVSIFALHDFDIIKQLFHYDFSLIKEKLHTNIFDILCNYQALNKKENMYNKNVSNIVTSLAKDIALANDNQAIYNLMANFYQDYGVGMFGLNKAFRLKENSNEITLVPINNMDEVKLDDLIGYELQKQKLYDNTKAFVEGGKANNVLLYGDSGTGKSTSIKAIVNEFYPQGLRMIEIYKHQFKDLSTIISTIKNRNYRFIIYMDDLSFEEFEIEYKFLKAVIEGGVETKPDNILIYATSNRRHLIRETWSDKNDTNYDDELHHSDTVQEKLSLVARFGLSICYERPRQKDYFHIVIELAKRYPQLTLSEEQLCNEARIWELSHGGMSGRGAQQLINHLLTKV